MKQENEKTRNGIWSRHEHYVFCAILSHLGTLGRPLQVKEIAHLYAKTRKIVIQHSIEIILTAINRATDKYKISQLDILCGPYYFCSP